MLAACMMLLICLISRESKRKTTFSLSIIRVDFHFGGRFPEGKALAASFAELSPGSKTLAIPLGVATFISINLNKYLYYSTTFHNRLDRESFLYIKLTHSKILFLNFFIGKWSAISEDSCGKTKDARPHRLSCQRQMSRGGLRFVRGKRKK